MSPLSIEEPCPDDATLQERYPQVARFAEIMRIELWANRGKGDREVWLRFDPKDLTYDISWHLVKLMAALKSGDMAGVAEHSADVANMAMMVTDVCKLLVHEDYRT